jgi:putative aldouronate transport system permease protein
MNIFLFFPVPILLALMLNEVRRKYRNVVQTIVYIPHLVSWVVVAGLTFTLFSPEGGTINQILGMAGLPQINILLSTSTFRPMILLQNIWKESGWGTILFLATISAIDPTLYEAAIVDGAGRWHQLKYITFPSILPTIITLLTLRIGQFLDTGFEQIMLMINAINRNVGEVFDTYIYEIGIRGGQLSYSTAIGLFKSIIAFILVFLANKIVKKLGEEGIF